VLDPVTDDAQGKRERPPAGLISRGAVRQDAGQGRNLANPTAVLLAVDLDLQHCAHTPPRYRQVGAPIVVAWPKTLPQRRIKGAPLVEAAAPKTFPVFEAAPFL
jgi:hypothetical protein